MTALTLTALARESPRLKAVVRFFADLFASIREARAMMQRYETLSHLSDAALARQGLTRADIPRTAVFGRSGR
jgi:uncharacterized protein YjiS (DUF1127 family)